jgi:DNA-binding beta-propeller fold protein YncE
MISRRALAGLVGLGPILAHPRLAPAGSLDDPRSYVFVVNEASKDVAVLDAGEARLVARLPLGHAAFQIAVSAERRLLFASDLTGQRINVVDLATGEMRAPIDLGFLPIYMQLAPTDDLLLVNGLPEDGMWLIPLDDPGGRRRIEGLIEPHNVVFDGDARTLTVADLGTRALAVVDVDQATVIAVVPTDDPSLPPPVAGSNGQFPALTNLSVTPDGSHAICLYASGGQVVVTDLTRRRPIAALDVSGTAWRAIPVPFQDLVLIPNLETPTLSLVSMETWREVERLPTGAEVTAVAVAWLGSLAFILDRKERTARILDLAQRAQVGTIALPGAPVAAVTAPDSVRVFVVLRDPDGVAVIDARELRVTSLIDDVGRWPIDAIVVGSRNFCS